MRGYEKLFHDTDGKVVDTQTLWWEEVGLPPFISCTKRTWYDHVLNSMPLKSLGGMLKSCY